MKTFKQFCEVKDDDLLKRFARMRGVSLDISTPEPGYSWQLRNIERNGPQKGAGAKVLHAINKLADKRQKRLELTTANHDLIKFYRKFGYVKSDHNNRFEVDNIKMYRMPKTSQ